MNMEEQETNELIYQLRIAGCLHKPLNLFVYLLTCSLRLIFGIFTKFNCCKTARLLNFSDIATHVSCLIHRIRQLGGSVKGVGNTINQSARSWTN